MLNVFASSFMTATRINAPHIRDMQKPDRRKQRWLPDYHWWKDRTRDVDLNNL